MVIRACNNIEYFQNQFEHHLDEYTKINSPIVTIQRWFQSRLDLISCVFVAVVALASILGKGIKIRAIGGLILIFNKLFQ